MCMDMDMDVSRFGILRLIDLRIATPTHATKVAEKGVQ